MAQSRFPQLTGGILLDCNKLEPDAELAGSLSLRETLHTRCRPGFLEKEPHLSLPPYLVSESESAQGCRAYPDERQESGPTMPPSGEERGSR